MSEDEVVQALLHAFDARADLRVQFREAYRAGAAAREAECNALREQVRRTALGLGGCCCIEPPCPADNRCGWCAAVALGVVDDHTARSTPSGEER